MKMLPKSYYDPEDLQQPVHEPVNDIHVHRYTMQQLFVPVSESRHFTREDAAREFHTTMLSVDKRSRQPQLIQMEARMAKGMPRNESLAKFYEQTSSEEERIARKILGAQNNEEKLTTRVQSDRCEFRFRDMSVQEVGRDGRARGGVGWRYGVPHQDRKKGMVKIPTSVP